MNMALRTPVSAVLKKLSFDGCKQISCLSARCLRNYHDRYLAVCIERLPIKACEMTEMEQKYFKTLQEVEFENSGKSDFELREENEKKSKPKDSSAKSSDILSDKNPLISLKDFEDNRLKELENLKTLPKSVEEQTDKIITSTKRKLSESIYLVTKQNIGTKDEAWLPPQDVIGKDETIKSAAKRIVQSVLGENSKVVFYGNAPFKYDEYKFTSEENGVKKVQKQKVFYYSAKYVSGADIKKEIPHQWLSANELKKTIPDFVHKSMVNSLLMCK